MSIDHFDQFLRELLDRKPFGVFTIELHGGYRYEVDHPGALTLGEGTASFHSPDGIRIYIDHDSVNQIFDAPSALCP